MEEHTIVLHQLTDGVVSGHHATGSLAACYIRDGQLLPYSAENGVESQLKLTQVFDDTTELHWSASLVFGGKGASCADDNQVDTQVR
jgi:hypothetical protein